uniref:ATP synthase F0 subunit 8 n=1 Tax=Lasioglossum laevigatum TaxID=88530 RepID=A0A0S2LSS6_9HYME|nr:ATP synthase F0 subunit 8 [Lasioglossum laevigatum]
MPQMSPMYWTLLLIYTLMIMYLYISMLYFTPTFTPSSLAYLKKYPLLFKKLKFKIYKW